MFSGAEEVPTLSCTWLWRRRSLRTAVGDNFVTSTTSWKIPGKKETKRGIGGYNGARNGSLAA